MDHFLGNQFTKKSSKQPEIEIDMKEVQRLHQDTHGIPKLELHAHIGGCFRP